MTSTVLVPLDGSAVGERALPYALAVARATQRALVLARVLSPSPTRGMPLVQEPTARTELEVVAERLRGQGVEVETMVSSTLFGSLAEVILELALKHGCDLIAMSTHGRGGRGRRLYGSVAEEVLSKSPIPVLLASATCDRAWPDGTHLRVLLPFDGSALAEQAFEPLLASTLAVASEFVVLRVAPPPGTDAAAYIFEDVAAEMAEAQQSTELVAERLRHRGFLATTVTRVGFPGVTIAQVARDHEIDLIAMATHGRSGLARLVLGSVATETLERSTTPLLLVRPVTLTPTESPPREPGQPRETSEPLTVLVALDLTDKAEAAVGPALRLVRGSSGRIVLLNVFNPLVDMGHLTAGTDAERVEYVCAERKMYLDERARAYQGVDVSTRVEVQRHSEEVDECIARVAHELEADVLVVVSKRTASTAAMVLGSFAQGVMRLSPCPVLVVQPPHPQAEAAASRSGRQTRIEHGMPPVSGAPRRPSGPAHGDHPDRPGSGVPCSGERLDTALSRYPPAAREYARLQGPASG
jgi:nucleotide-binding universal stress UspA family protein